MLSIEESIQKPTYLTIERSFFINNIEKFNFFSLTSHPSDIYIVDFFSYYNDNIISMLSDISQIGYVLPNFFYLYYPFGNTQPSSNLKLDILLFFNKLSTIIPNKKLLMIRFEGEDLNNWIEILTDKIKFPP